ncbi:hypothetical protein BDW22DRAFT_1427366 [Trametopsis cervina]|nr:hypothetical protein BDW22DRAFT_1427366 [Trametopsis cervina]
MHSTLKTVLLALLVAQQAWSQPVLQGRQLSIVDDITCSMVSKHVEAPTKLVSHLMRRAPAPALDASSLSDILAACRSKASSQHNKKLPAHQDNGSGAANESGNGQYPPYGNSASTAPGSTSGATSASGTGSGSSGVGANSAASANTGPQASHAGGSPSSTGGKVPFNPASAPYVVTRRATEPSGGSSPPATRPASGKSKSNFNSDISDEGYQRPSTPQRSSADGKRKPSTNHTKESNTEDDAPTKCVGQGGPIDCALQGLGL